MHRAFGVEHSRSRFFDEHATRLSEIDDFLALAKKQWKAKLFFELGYLLAECRLADIQSDRCAREIQFFGQNDDSVQVTYFNVWIQHLKPPMAAQVIGLARSFVTKGLGLSGTEVGNFHSMWKLSSVVNLGTSFEAEPQVYNVFAVVPLGATVSNRLILREKSARREDV